MVIWQKLLWGWTDWGWPVQRTSKRPPAHGLCCSDTHLCNRMLDTFWVLQCPADVTPSWARQSWPFSVAACPCSTSCSSGLPASRGKCHKRAQSQFLRSSLQLFPTHLVWYELPQGHQEAQAGRLARRRTQPLRLLFPRRQRRLSALHHGRTTDKARRGSRSPPGAGEQGGLGREGRSGAVRRRIFFRAALLFSRLQARARQGAAKLARVPPRVPPRLLVLLVLCPFRRSGWRSLW